MMLYINRWKCEHSNQIKILTDSYLDHYLNKEVAGAYRLQMAKDQVEVIQEELQDFHQNSIVYLPRLLATTDSATTQ